MTAERKPLTKWERGMIVRSLIDTGSTLHKAANTLRHLSPGAAAILEQDYDRVMKLAGEVESLPVQL